MQPLWKYFEYLRPHSPFAAVDSIRNPGEVKTAEG